MKERIDVSSSPGSTRNYLFGKGNIALIMDFNHKHKYIKRTIHDYCPIPTIYNQNDVNNFKEFICTNIPSIINVELQLIVSRYKHPDKLDGFGAFIYVKNNDHYLSCTRNYINIMKYKGLVC